MATMEPNMAYSYVHRSNSLYATDTASEYTPCKVVGRTLASSSRNTEEDGSRLVCNTLINADKIARSSVLTFVESLRLTLKRRFQSTGGNVITLLSARVTRKVSQTPPLVCRVDTGTTAARHDCRGWNGTLQLTGCAGCDENGC